MHDRRNFLQRSVGLLWRRSGAKNCMCCGLSKITGRESVVEFANQPPQDIDAARCSLNGSADFRACAAVVGRSGGKIEFCVMRLRLELRVGNAIRTAVTLRTSVAATKEAGERGRGREGREEGTRSSSAAELETSGFRPGSGRGGCV